MYKIKNINESGHLQCVRQGRFPIYFPEVPSFDWNSVGVYRKGPETNKNVIILPADVHGKVIEVNDMLITCPNNILTEK